MSGAHQEDYEKTLFGFWVYLITDFMLFGSLIAVYIVLDTNTFGGPSAKDLFSLPFALIQSLLMLVVAFTSGMGSLKAHERNLRSTLTYFLVAAALSSLFLWRMLQEFQSIQLLGFSWKDSGFLSAYYSLNGIFALHVILGLIWTLLCLVFVTIKGFQDVSLKRLSCLKMFWQFLNIVWVFIFAIVYLSGVC